LTNEHTEESYYFQASERQKVIDFCVAEIDVRKFLENKISEAGDEIENVNEKIETTIEVLGEKAQYLILLTNAGECYTYLMNKNSNLLEFEKFYLLRDGFGGHYPAYDTQLSAIETCGTNLYMAGTNAVDNDNPQKKLGYIFLANITNICGIELYTENILNNLKLTLDGVVKNVDICLMNDKPFIYVAAIGKFADIPYETPRKLKKNIGYLAYVSEGVKSFFNKTRLQEIVYEVDGVEYRGLFSFIIISSANRISGINNFYKDVKLDDNKFEVLLCNISKKKDIIKSLYLLTMYDVSKVPGIYSYKTDNFKIKFIDMPRKPWCVDGEKLEDIEKRYEISIDGSLKMMIPKKNIDKLFIKK
jgi:hypothetical protein